MKKNLKLKNSIQIQKKNTNTSCIHHFCQADSDDSDASIHQQSIRSSGGTSTTASSAKKPPTTRAASTESTTSTESSASSNAAVRPSSTTAAAAAAKQTTKPEVPASAVRSRTSTETVTEKKPFQSRFLPNHQTPASTSVDKKDESESSSEEETTSEEETEEEEEEEEEADSKKTTAAGKDTALKTDIGPLLNRSTHARDAYADTRRTSRDETTNSRTGHSSPTYGRSFEESKYPTARSRTTAHHTDDDHNSSRYGSSSTG